VNLFSCGHVVPLANRLTITLAKSPSGDLFDFTFGNRFKHKQVNGLGNALVNLTSIVPDGVVVFFPSFAYESYVMDEWHRSGIFKRLSKNKTVFREPRLSSDVEAILQAFSDCILDSVESAKEVKKHGAMLSCVVGAKMSEGINFSDRMARLVVVVGLPFSNPHDAELRERMSYLDRTIGSTTSSQRTPGEEYYENLCMRSVNQSIGRSIRWSGDYACILLIDHRYSQNRIHSQLPDWIQDRILHATQFRESYREVIRFFRDKKKAAAVA